LRLKSAEKNKKNEADAILPASYKKCTE